MTKARLNWFKYLALLVVLAALVYAVPILWEIGVVGAVGGAVWIFVWPKPEASADDGGSQN